MGEHLSFRLPQGLSVQCMQAVWRASQEQELCSWNRRTFTSHFQRTKNSRTHVWCLRANPKKRVNKEKKQQGTATALSSHAWRTELPTWIWLSPENEPKAISLMTLLNMAKHEVGWRTFQEKDGGKRSTKFVVSTFRKVGILNRSCNE